MATESNDPQAQSASPTPAAEAIPSAENPPSNLSPAEQLAGLNLDQLLEVTARLNPDEAKRREGVDAGDKTPQPEAAPEVPAAGEPEPAPEEDPENKPGRIRVDKIADDRTRGALEFMARNRDATIEDALAFVDAQNPKPAPAAPPTGPDLNAMQAKVADLTGQLKTKGDPLSDQYDQAAAEEIRGQLLDAKVDLRFARESAARQQATVQEQRTATRNASAERAVALCPEINDPATPQGVEFARIYGELQGRNDPLLHNDDAPRIIGLLAMANTGYTPKATPPAAPAPPPASTPSKPVAPPVPTVRSTVPVARTNAPAPAPATAPGSSRITPAVAPNAAQLAETLHNLSIDDLEEVAAATGKKLMPSPVPYSFA